MAKEREDNTCSEGSNWCIEVSPGMQESNNEHQCSGPDEFCVKL